MGNQYKSNFVGKSIVLFDSHWNAYALFTENVI